METRAFILGGFIAGLVITIGDLALVALYLGDALVAGGQSAKPTTALFIFHLAIKFSLGYAVFAIYLLARQVQKPPLPPMVLVPLIGWVILYPSITAILHNLGALAVTGLAILAAWGAVELYLAVALAVFVSRKVGQPSG